MNSTSIYKSVRSEFRSRSAPANVAAFKRFFKEPVVCYGMKAKGIREVADRYWKEAKNLSKRELFALCEKLLRTKYSEDAFVASLWLPKIASQFTPGDFRIFRNWIDKYVDNWAKCDSFCNHTVGDLVTMYPALVTELKKWTRSRNRWMRRAAAVSLIVPAKKGMFLDEAFEIADAMLTDTDDMVQKGYGWLLKEESRTCQKEVFEFVMRRKNVMPRTALRYAIELMPSRLKIKAMTK